MITTTQLQRILENQMPPDFHVYITADGLSVLSDNPANGNRFIAELFPETCDRWRWRSLYSDDQNYGSLLDGLASVRDATINAAASSS